MLREIAGGRAGDESQVFTKALDFIRRSDKSYNCFSAITLQELKNILVNLFVLYPECEA